ncbi:MAG TPA: ATP synthase F1 subunit delta [Candidatus Sulfotelmatobacter sp.]|nr:ATP synthase F1 subunit delta [Candidatus Sulfotelmatobacter sp.]
MAAVLARYARAFAEVTVQHKLNPDTTVAELAQVASLIDGNRELRNVLQNPSVPSRQKLALLDAIMQRTGGSKLLRNFLAVLIDHRRIGSIGEIVEQFKQELDRRMGIADARVSSARVLSATEKKSLEKHLSEITGMAVRATYSEDGTLLGGVMVRMGSTIYDGSVQGRLEKMRKEIAS